MLLKSIARILVKYAGNAVGFGVAGDAILEIWDSWNKDQPDPQEKRAEVQQLAQQSAGETRQAAADIGLELLADQSQEVRQTVTIYLTQVPAMIRRSLRRPADPTGTTIPHGVLFTKAEHLGTVLPPKVSRFKPGDQPPGIGDWELVELLGVGGFGEVWKAHNPYFDSVPNVALKFCTDAEAARTLRHEAAILNQVMRQGKHEGIVQLQHSYLNANPPCLEYEFVEGGDLAGLIRDWHRASTGCSPDRVAGLMFQLAKIVGFAHRLNPAIVHRDLKPANILVQQASGGEIRLKIADFGIGGIAASQAIREAVKGMSQGLYFTAVSTGTYTPRYASPQQMAGRPADPRDDVYALGVIWYQLLTGDLNTGRPGGRRWHQKLSERGLTPAMVELLEGCFEDIPEDRPNDAAELAQQMETLLQLPKVSTAKPTQPETLRETKSEKPIEGPGPSDLAGDVLVIPARDAWDMYKGIHAYSGKGLHAYCTAAGRTYRPVKYIAFYTGNQIHPLIPQVLDGSHDQVVLERGKYSGRLGEVVNQLLDWYDRGSLPASWGDIPGLTKVFILSAPDAAETVKLDQPIVNDLTSRNGQRIAFTQNRRYVSLAALRKAKKTSDLGGAESEAPGAGHEETTSSTEPEGLRKRFWDRLLSRPTAKATRHAEIATGEYSRLPAGSGVRGLPFQYVIRQDEGTVELYIDRGSGQDEGNKRIFDWLEKRREEIERAFGGKLSWERLDGKQGSRVACNITVGGYKSDESKWPAIQDAMIDAMIRLEKALALHLEKLKTELAAEGA